ncbi:hypothetical protein D3093_15345 (plasmid) [Azospirillum argentinense]|uniref:Uncharacterized protein n=1 Tax=Azospirillum argentinense TaxID=2970906 RepID=A0A4D8PM24_9PROT|nr:hypothetical protein [Azospirillum argentinense]QCN96705.1 hypothetical protein D3093_15345 [Azospirillum argentinense]
MPRFQIEMSDDGLKELERLVDLTKASTKKEVINNALTLLAWAIRQRREGFEIGATRDGRTISKQLEMPILSNIKADAPEEHPPLANAN